MIIAAALTLSGCATTASSQKEKQAKKEQKAAMIRKAIDDRTFIIDVNMAYPQGHPAINVTSNYSLEMKGDSVISYLPYYGRAYRVPYGGGKGLNFSGKAVDYAMEQLKNDRTRISFRVANDEDTYLFLVSVFTNGSADISVTSNEREPISFGGTMEEVKNK